MLPAWCASLNGFSYGVFTSLILYGNSEIYFPSLTTTPPNDHPALGSPPQAVPNVLVVPSCPHGLSHAVGLKRRDCCHARFFIASIFSLKRSRNSHAYRSMRLLKLSASLCSIPSSWRGFFLMFPPFRWTCRMRVVALNLCLPYKIE